MNILLIDIDELNESEIEQLDHRLKNLHAVFYEVSLHLI